MLTAFKKPPRVNVEKFVPMKSRVNDLFNNMGDQIRDNKTIMAWSGIFAEMLWLVNEITRLGGVPEVDAARFAKVAKNVKRVNVEQEGGIKAGQFMKVGAGVIASYRFLVRNLESLMLQYLDDDEAYGLIEEKLADEGTNRITLDDLEDKIPDEDLPKE